MDVMSCLRKYLLSIFALTRGQESQDSAGAQRGSGVISDVKRLKPENFVSGAKGKGD